MVKIWYEASVLAHDFVPADFWAEQREAMRNLYLPRAENLVFEEEGKVSGFISLVGTRVCALFVAPESQGRGIGSALLEHAKALKGKLSLRVYRENKKAPGFYEKHGFTAAGEEIDGHTGCVQLLMEWG